MNPSQVVVAQFATGDDALGAMETFNELDRQGFLTLGEAALITRDVDGTMHASLIDGTERRAGALDRFEPHRAALEVAEIPPGVLAVLDAARP